MSSESATEQLAKLLQDANVRVQIGLRQQGHLPTVDRMLREGASWDDIGRAIGWCGKAAERWYRMECEHDPSLYQPKEETR